MDTVPASDPNDELLRQLARARRELMEKGMQAERAVPRALELLTDALSETAPEIADDYERIGLNHVAELREYEVGFGERLRAHWGDALDLYLVVVTIIHQAAQHFSHRNRNATAGSATLIGVLHRLNGQALRVAREVHVLASNGYPLGALSLSRTSHEISVRAAILSEFGTTEEHADLAERFVRHAEVDAYKDAVTYQRDAAALGYDALDDKLIDDLKQRHDEAISQYDKPFRAAYGWASGLPRLPTPTPSFRDLEELAGLSHHRGLYKWSSHLVHADAKALELSVVERGGRAVVLTAATNQGVADPAQHAILGLYRTFVSLVTCVPLSPYDELTCRVLRRLIDKVDRLLVEAEQAVDDAEDRLQEELASRGMRFDPVDGEVPLIRNPDPPK